MPIISARGFAGVGRLVVVAEEKNPEVSVNAWVDVAWVISGRALCREIELLYSKATSSTQRAGKRTTASLLLGDDLADALDANDTETVQANLSVIAAIHGFDLQILRRPRRHTASVLEHIRRTPPGLLVIAAPQDSKVEAVVREYRATGVTPRVYQLGARRPEEITEDFREIAGVASGINPGLFPIAASLAKKAEVDSAAPEESQLLVPGVWPVTYIGRELILDGFGRYVENISDGFWYTRDRAGHAGSRVKKYRRQGRMLYHDSDIDGDGNVIPKHKGEIGAAVSLDDMRGI